MNRSLLVLCFILQVLSPATGQTYEYVYRNKHDSSVNCYLKMIPAGMPVRGLVVRDFSSLPDTSIPSRSKIADLCAEQGVMTLYTVTTTIFPDLYYDDTGPVLLDEMIQEVLTAHHIPKQNLFIGGLSASGTRALRYAQYCEMGKSKYGNKVAGVFAVDPPLDIERFYYSARNNKNNFKAGMLAEAEIVPSIFIQKLGGTPEQKTEAYRQASVFSYLDSTGGNARYYKDVPVILFHEPDINWWITERGANYYDINSFDIAGFVNKLKVLGSTKVEMVTTTGKGFDWEGKRNCHSWKIVDEPYLLKWILGKMT